MKIKSIREVKGHFRLMVIIVLLLALAVIASVFIYYVVQKRESRHGAVLELTDIAGSKALWIELWRARLFQNAEELIEVPALNNALKSYLRNPDDNELRLEMLAWFEYLCGRGDITNVSLVDVSGQVIVSFPDNARALMDHARESVAEAVRDKRVVALDFNRIEGEEHLNLGITIPILSREENSVAAIGAVVFKADPNIKLYRELQKWPKFSRSAKTLLVRRVGKNVVFLNEPRFYKDAPLNLKFPVNKINLPAVMAVRGKQGLVDGKDYRGIPVLAVIRPIPKTDWFLIVKIDQSEVYEGLLRHVVVFGLMACVVALLLFSAFVIYLRELRVKQYKAQYERELDNRLLTEHLSYVTKYANDIIILSDNQWNIRDANEPALSAYGYGREELLKKRFFDLVDPKSIPSFEREIRTIDRSSGQIFEIMHLRKDGDVFPGEINSRVIEIDDKVFYQSIIRDITERTRTLKLLEDTRRQLEFILGVTKTGVDIIDRDYNMVYIDPKWQEVYGEYAGKKCYEYFLSRDSVCSGCGVEEALRTKMPVTFEEVLSKEGNRVVMRTVVPYQEDDGGWSVVAINVDVSKKRQLEQDLLRAAQEWRTTFDAISAMISIHDKEYRIVRANRAFADAFNMHPKDLVGKTYHELSHAQAAPWPDIPHRQRLDTSSTRKIEFFDSRLGVWFSASVSPIIEGDDEAVYCVHILEDVTDYKRAQEQLTRALQEEKSSHEIVISMLEDNDHIREELENKLRELQQAQSMLVQSEKLASIGKLVSDMAHEVNNPLMIISGNAQLSLLDETANDELKNNLKIIHEECNRAKSIIQRLLMFSRPSKGEFKALDINRSIEAVVKLLEHQFGLSNVEINRRFGADLPRIFADEKQIQEVIMNFLNNARDAMPKGGGEIAIETALDEGDIRIQVRDTGTGMDDKTLNRLFEPFFTTKEHGTGLGLSVCYGIIKAHDGRIEFKSKPGDGTTASVWLPVRAEGA